MYGLKIFLYTLLLSLGLILARYFAENPVKAQTAPAFPGAEGFGSTTPGGRGGQVIEVTNLNNSGSGSFRACAEASGPRTCVFRRGGTIVVQSRIDIIHPYLTIAGQTAPGGGIALKNGSKNTQAPLAILTHDVIIRYLRVRPGPIGDTTSTIDAITIINEPDDDHPDREVFNIIIDHSSFSWATDEVVNIWDNVHDVTIQWSIISEGLNCSNHPLGCHSKGMLVGSDGVNNITFHHNLLAHSEGRNPALYTAGVVDMVNNVVYVPKNVMISLFDAFQHVKVNVVGNYGLTDPNNNDGLAYLVQKYDNGFGASIYVNGNIDPNRTQENQNEALVVWPDSRQYVVGTRHPAPAVTTTSAFTAFDQVLDQAGATHGLNAQGEFFWRRDAVDLRIVNDTRNGTGGLINHPGTVGGWPTLSPGTPYVDSDHDGMPDIWEEMYGFDPHDPSDSNKDADRDGYTNLEEFLNGTDPGRGSTQFIFLPYIRKS